MRDPFVNALPVYVNALADQTNVKVMYGAAKTYTTGKVVYLTAANADNPVQRAMTVGKAVHEVGHVKHSDFDILAGMSALEKMVSNILEDIFVERKMFSEFPGVKQDLCTMAEVLVAEKFFSEPEAENATPAQIMQTFMLYALRSEVLGQGALDAHANRARQILVEKIPLGMRTRLEALMFRVTECENSQDVLDLTRVIIRMMEDEAKKEEEKEQQQKPDASSNQQQGEGGTGQPQAGKDSDPNEGQSGQPSPDKGDGSLDAKDDSTGNPGNDKSQAGDAQDGSGTGADSGSKIIKSILSAGEDQINESVGDLLSRVLDANAVPASADSNVTPFKVLEFRPSSVGVNIEAEQNRVSASSNAIKVRTQALLQTQTRATRHSALAGSRLSVGGLYRAKLDGRVFEQVKEGIKVDTAVMILIDASTSMRGGEIRLACDAALTTTLAFDRPGIKTAVMTFPHGRGACAALKGWDMRPSAAIPAFTHIQASGTTPMAEAMLTAGIALKSRPEKRKVLLVNTDGDPDSLGKAKWVADIARRGGIQVLGIGIGTDASEVFGKGNTAQIDSIAGLPSAMIGMLERVVL